MLQTAWKQYFKWFETASDNSIASRPHNIARVENLVGKIGCDEKNENLGLSC